MAKFPVDASKRKVVKTFEALGFRMIREREHIVMVRDNEDGTQTPLVMPNQTEIKSGTLRAICTQVRISREEFLDVYNRI
jgi:predicted RNA binding protein YcfA (HicA-like mRNA interferase family)